MWRTPAVGRLFVTTTNTVPLVYIHTHTCRRNTRGWSFLLFFSFSLSPLSSGSFPPLLLAVSSLTLRPRSVSITSRHHCQSALKAFSHKLTSQNERFIYTQSIHSAHTEETISFPLHRTKCDVYTHKAKTINYCPYTFYVNVY
jgi:hypothetical protein